MLDVPELARHGSALRATARAVVRCAHEAEDVVQDAWVHALEDRVGRPNGPLAWMRAVVRNMARARRRTLDSRSPELLADRIGADALGTETAAPAGADALARSEVALEIARAVHALPPRYRDVIIHRYWEGASLREIAASAGLPLKSVQNLHHRAVVRLRASLHPELGSERSRWPAFIAFGWPSSSKLAPALLLMKVQTKGVVLILALVAVTLLLGGWWWWRPVASRAPAGPQVAEVVPSAPEAAEELEPVAGDEAEPAPARAPAGDAEPVETAASSVVTPEQAASTDPGVLTLAAIGADTQADLEAVILRGLSDSRFMEATVHSPAQLKLTPGSYELLVRSPGYDALELPVFSIRSGEVTDLGMLVLERGRSTLEIVVQLPSGLSTRQLRLELYGAGRSRCAACPDVPRAELGEGEHCTVCGYGREGSAKSGIPGEPVLFAGLAGGNYHIVVYDSERDMLLATRETTVRPRSQEWLELDLSFGDLAFHLTGPDDAPFGGQWVEEGVEYSGPIRFFLLADETCCGATLVQPDVQRQPSMPFELEQAAPPPPREDLDELATLRHEEAVSLGTAPPRDAEPRSVDVPRNERHTLWPSIMTPPPDVRTQPLPIVRQRRGEYLLRDVPGDANRVVVTCGPYFETLDIADEAWEGAPIEVRLSRRCGAPSGMIEGTTTCVSCHALPTGVLQ